MEPGVGEVVEEGLPGAAVSRAVQQHDAGVCFLFGEAEYG